MPEPPRNGTAPANTASSPSRGRSAGTSSMWRIPLAASDQTRPSSATKRAMSRVSSHEPGQTETCRSSPPDKGHEVLGPLRAAHRAGILRHFASRMTPAQQEAFLDSMGDVRDHLRTLRPGRVR